MRITTVLLGLSLAGYGCTKKPAEAPEKTGENERADVHESPEASPKFDESMLADLERALRDCDGQALAAIRNLMDVDRLREVEGDGEQPASVRVWARWERIRAEGTQDDKMTISEFAVEFERRFGITAPPWWIEHLASGQPSEVGPAVYDTGLGHDFDRRGQWTELDSGARIRSEDAMVLGESGGTLYLDLSSRRTTLGPVPPAGSMVEYVRPRGGRETYLATFQPGSGGLPFPVRRYQNDEKMWETRSCGTGRSSMGGKGHLTVELSLIDESEGHAGRMAPPQVTAVAVFSAESHGVAFELLDPETGERTAAFTSDVWSAER